MLSYSEQRHSLVLFVFFSTKEKTELCLFGDVLSSGEQNKLFCFYGRVEKIEVS